MTRLRALPSRGWYAIVALVVLASVGVTAVLGAGLQVWRGTISAAPQRIAAGDLRVHPRSVITVPARPRGATHHAGPATSPTTAVHPPAAPAAPATPAASKPAGHAAGKPTTRIARVHPPTPVLPTAHGQTPTTAVATPAHPAPPVALPAKAARHVLAARLRFAKRHFLARTVAVRGPGLRWAASRTIAARNEVLQALPSFRVARAAPTVQAPPVEAPPVESTPVEAPPVTAPPGDAPAAIDVPPAWGAAAAVARYRHDADTDANE